MRCWVAPSRGRGSKQYRLRRMGKSQSRPLTGARIETARTSCPPPRRRRRPLTGARIETTSMGLLSGLRWSPPHGGADRNPITQTYYADCMVSPPHGGADRNEFAENTLLSTHTRRPLTGARIETWADRQLRWRLHSVAPSRGRGSKLTISVIMSTAGKVAPSRGRGSKPRGRAQAASRLEVAPSRGRGSKLSTDIPECGKDSRPLTGARIETLGVCANSQPPPSPPHGGADRNGTLTAML